MELAMELAAWICLGLLLLVFHFRLRSLEDRITDLEDAYCDEEEEET